MTLSKACLSVTLQCIIWNTRAVLLSPCCLSMVMKPKQCYLLNQTWFYKHQACKAENQQVEQLKLHRLDLMPLIKIYKFGVRDTEGLQHFPEPKIKAQQFSSLHEVLGFFKVSQNTHTQKKNQSEKSFFWLSSRDLYSIYKSKSLWMKNSRCIKSCPNCRQCWL